MKLCIHGHRPDKLGGWKQPNPVKDDIVTYLRSCLDKAAPEVVILGGDLGVPQWTASICVEKGIPFELVVPSADFSSKWPDISKKIYQDICKKAKNVTVINPTSAFIPSAIYTRNRHMVVMSDSVVVVWDGSSGITSSLREDAISRGKLVDTYKPSGKIAELAVASYKSITSKKAPEKTINEEEQKELAKKVLGLQPKNSVKVDHWNVGEEGIPKEDRPKPTVGDKLSPNRVVEID